MSVYISKVASFDELRAIKGDYKAIPIDTSSKYYNEPTAGVYSYGIAGQSYYSRPNPATVNPVAGVPAEPRLRVSVLEKLATINNALQSSTYDRLFGGRVELYIQEGVRLYAVQKLLYEETFPALVKKQYPNISDIDLKKRLTRLIAKPSVQPSSPAPHATGGAFDMTIRYKQSECGYVEDVDVLFKKVRTDTSLVNYPDYFETLKNPDETDVIIRENRRILFAIMTGKLFGIETGFACNPTEWWHWSWGDQLWAQVTGSNNAVYSVVKEAI